MRPTGHPVMMNPPGRGQGRYDQGEPVLKDLSGFAGPVVIVAAHGTIDPVDQTWAGR